MKSSSLRSIFSATLLAAASSAALSAEPAVTFITLDFENVLKPDADEPLFYPSAEVLEFYNGGPSAVGTTFTVNLGVSFSAGALATESSAGADAKPDPTRYGLGSFDPAPSGLGVMRLDEPSVTMNFKTGFDTRLSFSFSSTDQATVTLFSGENGSGSEVGVIKLEANVSQQLCPTSGNLYCKWDEKFLDLKQGDIVRSVRFEGVAGQAGFDLIRFQVTTPIPEPSTYALMALGLAAVGFAARRRRAAQA